MTFSKDFVWGAAAASYQIEGGWDADGKGPSVWDMLCRQEGRIFEGHTGDVACNHYHRYREDVALMRSLGLKAYRLSLSWPRILPEGQGRVNEAGLGFYDRLVDELLAAGVQPWVTLFHWDYPYALFCRGGWLNPRSSDWFEEYAQIVVDRLSDRVKHWMTLNEPQCFIGLGHLTGMHAPGLKLGLAEVLRAAHNALLAHGKAVRIIRARAKSPATVGWAPVGIIHFPASDKPEDVAAARERTAAVANRDLWNNTWFSDPAVFGRYPEDGLRRYGRDVPAHPASDLEIIRQPLDFYGANIYNGTPGRRGPDGGFEPVGHGLGYAHTHFYWPVTPPALYWGPKFLHERYQLPIVITENGMANPDWPALDGQVHDTQRIDFLQRYLREYRRAAADGVPVKGYFLWSIMDNFEWAEGYKQRFGIVHVDYATGKRTPKDSALWYKTVIAANGENL